MSNPIHATKRRPPIRPLFQFRLGKLMALVALCAVFISAWQFRRDNASIERSMTSRSIRAVSEGDKARRLEAIEELAHAKADDLFRVVAALAGALGDDEWPLRSAAARSLGSAIGGCIGSGSKAIGAEIDLAEGALIQAFGDPHAEVRLEAVRAVGSIHAAVTVHRVRPRMPSTTVTLQLRTTDAPSRPLVRPDARRHNSPSRARRGRPASLRRSLLPPELEPTRSSTSSITIPQVGHCPCQPRLPCALVSGWPDPVRFYPLFLDRLKEVTDPDQRKWIGWVLGSLPPPPVEMVPALIDALELDDDALRWSIPMALAQLGPLARAALPALAKAASRELADPGATRLDAAVAIATIGPDSAEGQALLAQLVALLRRSKQGDQWIPAAWVLAIYGPSAAAAVPSIREGLQSTVANVRQQAAFALGRNGPAAQYGQPGTVRAPPRRSRAVCTR